MYEYKSIYGSILRVTKELRSGGVTVSVYQGIGGANLISISQEETLKLVQSLLELSGVEATLVQHVDQGRINYTRSGSGVLSCGTGGSRVILGVDADLPLMDEIMANTATLVAKIRAQQIEEQKHTEKNRQKLARESTAKLLGIKVPKDDEGLKALDEIIKRRKA